MAVDQPLLRLVGVTKIYGDSETGQGIRGIDLEVRRGEFLAIMGTSGAGKSTLLNILGLLDDFDTGSYELLGEDVSRIRDRRADELRGDVISFVFQSSHVMPHETIERNAALGLSKWKLSRSLVEDRITGVLRAVGLDHRLGALARELSGGERQRLAIARAIAHPPQLLLADEPTGNLDEHNTHTVLELLRELNRRGVTVVLITHDRDVAAHASRVVTLRDGRIVDSTSATPTATRVGHDDLTLPRRRRSGARPVLDALNALTARMSRTLTLAGSLGLAVAGLVAAVGIGATASDQVAERLTQSALDEVHVNLSGSLTYDEADRMRATIEDLGHVTGAAVRTDLEPAEAGVTALPLDPRANAAFSGSVIAADSGWLELIDAEVEPRDAPVLLDQTANVALLGSGALESFGFNGPGEGRQVWVSGRPYDVVGEIVATGRLDYVRDAVVVSGSSVPLGQSEILVRVSPGFPAQVAEAIPYALSPANPGAVAVSTVADLRNLRHGVQSDLAALVGVIGGTLLLVAVLSAGTSMYLAIQGRVQEIALRRALGYRRQDIGFMFLMEGVLLGFAGSCLGLAVGLAGIVAASAAQSWTPSLPVTTVVLGLVCGVAAGALSAVLPAVRAARIQPAEAIRT
jgi:macrolide transport system ATP-binding/permease protein